MSDREREWRSLAGKLTRKINTGWVLQFLTPFLVVASLLVGATILILRTMQLPVQNLWFLVGTGLVLAGVITGACMMARKKFIDSKKGLVRLEEGLRLRNALTAADHGIAQWPPVPKDNDVVEKAAGFNWRWETVMLPFLIAAVSIAAALLIPIPEVEAAADLPPQEPSAWEQMEETLAMIEDEDIIEEEAIKEVREKIKELRDQPEEDWFGHASMEATDTLRETLNREVKELGREMETAERDLNALQNFSAQMSEKAKDKILKEFENALKNMELGQMQVSEELLEQLKSIDPKKLANNQMGNMTKEQMDQLREQMKKAAQAMKGMKLGENGEMPQMAEMTDEMKEWLRQMMGGGT